MCDLVEYFVMIKVVSRAHIFVMSVCYVLSFTCVFVRLSEVSLKRIHMILGDI